MSRSLASCQSLQPVLSGLSIPKTVPFFPWIGRVSHEPIKQLKTAKEKRTKNRLTKKPQKWNQGQITLGLTTEISLNPRLPPGLLLECAECLQSSRLQAFVLKPGTFLSFLPFWFQLHSKIRPYTRCNLQLTLLHTCRHCHSNLWQTESQMNLFCSASAMCLCWKNASLHEILSSLRVSPNFLEQRCSHTLPASDFPPFHGAPFAQWGFWHSTGHVSWWVWDAKLDAMRWV